jgi:putative peptidoglycan lipid II flippase
VDSGTVAPGGPLARSAGLAGSATLASRILGLARDQVLAAMFGAGNAMDAYIVAFRIPNLARDLFAEGAMSAAFVPTFTRHLTAHGKPDAWRVGNNVVNALLLITGLLVAGGMVFAQPLVTAYAGDYSSVPGKLELTVSMTRTMLPFLTLAAVAAALMGMLNSLGHFFIPALAPAMFNVAAIVCAVVLAPVMPAVGQQPIVAIAIAVIIGGFGQIAIQLRPLWREGFRFKPILDLRDPGLRRVLVLMGPGTIGLAATQVNLFVNTLLATSQGTGAASWLTYAFRLMYLPIGLFGVSIATAVLPAAAGYAAVDDRRGVRATVSRGLTLMLMLNVPATLGLVVLATPIVRLLFERGQFTAADTAATAAALQFYAIGLVGYSASRIASPVFYALGQSRVPVTAGSAAIALNIVASVILVRAAGFRGLALGTSLAALANGALLLALLRRRLSGIDGARLSAAFVKILIASLAMAAATFGAGQLMNGFATDQTVWVQAFELALSIAAGLVVLAFSARVLQIHEFNESLILVRHRVQKLLDPA